MQKIPKASVRPDNSKLNLLSHREVDGLVATSNQSVYELFRQCALAILNTGSDQDDGAQLLKDFSDFDIKVVQQSRGLKLEVFNAPESAFVDGQMINGIQEHLFSVLRDIVFTSHKMTKEDKFNLQSPEGITDAVFRILRNGDIVKPNVAPNLAVCWGGHSISEHEYKYTKQVGYELGLRNIDIVTGCGIGAMKGPMKGATIGHAKQRNGSGRYIGISEPGIIASESPNPIVNELVILPDIEKRLEAFVRLAHTIIVFPGGAGTAEEVLYILSLLMHPKNKNESLSLIFTAPKSSGDYFHSMDEFIRNTLGEEATQHYQIIIDDPQQVAKETRRSLDTVHQHRRKNQESYCYNWQLHIEPDLQTPFIPTHDNMAALSLEKTLPCHALSAQLRCAFSGIVAGNVKPFGIEQVSKYGPYLIKGEEEILFELDKLLRKFVVQRRMKLNIDNYQPCYKIVNS
ncbi:MAG: nucleotide 5'-monophosphate nucleosidase PpnN [Porticoccus sp.]|nr:nucleotide 5'-monophosphate nucleosidase PpnN [Porticoccus sp.]